MEINKIYNEDCLITMKTMADSSIDLIITSPPYNILNASHSKKKYHNYRDDNKSKIEYSNFLRERVSEMIRVSKITFLNIQFLSGNNIALIELLNEFKNHLSEIIIWDKINSEPAMSINVLNSQFEFILVFSKKNNRKFDRAFFSRGTLSNVWYIKKRIATKEDIKSEHFALFPKNLVNKILKNFSVENDLIYDPFMGLGTTAICCISSNRNYIGSEIDKKYFNITNDRLEVFRSQLKMAI